ncbi:FosX/FosE/FosI family fosfomycin resistance hydrolase [Clostridium sp. YIM B02551]|uniref:FosX/FosE/FosI family fosfomycin resistance hydrolase n=1 Tax=Clostridium sp. YIM B02551 TaxID=2910679 RepID=UPI0023B07D11|nr:FosX/FosE/FosI family fosfomycin resistance hydrolase [Clostridium sp. YIM B02551]
MIEGISHITFIVRDLEKTTKLFKCLFHAEEIYYSNEKEHSLFKERFFIIGGQWIAAMEDSNIVSRTYHHVAFKIPDSDVEYYLNKIKELNLELKPPRERVPGEGYSIYFYDYDNNLIELHTETLEKQLESYSNKDKLNQKIERRFIMEELKVILEKFADSGWDLIAIPSKAYLDGNGNKEALIEAIEQADKECGSCGCEFDPLYKRCIELKKAL